MATKLLSLAQLPAVFKEVKNYVTSYHIKYTPIINLAVDKPAITTIDAWLSDVGIAMEIYSKNTIVLLRNAEGVLEMWSLKSDSNKSAKSSWERIDAAKMQDALMEWVDTNYVSATSIGDYALKSYVDKKITDLVGGAPTTLDTLKEIADALGNDKNLSATLTAEIGKKANSADVYSKTTADATFLKSADLKEITAAEIAAAAESVFQLSV